MPLLIQIATKRQLEKGGDGDEGFYSFSKQQKTHYYPCNWDKVPVIYQELHLFVPIEGMWPEETVFLAVFTYEAMYGVCLFTLS